MLMNISVFVTEPFNSPNRGNDICYLERREREDGKCLMWPARFSRAAYIKTLAFYCSVYTSVY